MTGVPLVFSVGTVQDRLAEPVAGAAGVDGGALTAIAKGPIDALLLRVEAVMLMPRECRHWLRQGSRSMRPVLVLKAAHAWFSLDLKGYRSGVCGDGGLECIVLSRGYAGRRRTRELNWGGGRGAWGSWVRWLW